MISDAIKTIENMAIERKIVRGFKNAPFLVSDGTATPLPWPRELPDTLEVHTLTGLIDYLKSNVDLLDVHGAKHESTFHPFIVVDSPHCVRVLSQVQMGDFAQRVEHLKATTFNNNQWSQIPYGTWMSIESFIILMMSHFVADQTVSDILKVVGNVTSEASGTIADDGVSQIETARVGIAKVAAVSIPNPVKLRPYCTFPEVEQPQSNFVLRMRRADNGEPQVALFSSNDTKWMTDAISSIAEFLLSHEIGVPVLA
jgi:hypothetical protein